MFTIFCYHSISEDPHDIYAITPADFRAQLARIKKNFTIVPTSEIGKEHKHAACITFDDGFADFFSQAYPILRELDIPATLFVPTQYIGGQFMNKQMLNAEELQTLSRDARITLGCHSHTHPVLTTLSDEMLRDEYARSQAALTDITGTTPTMIAYPFGRSNKAVERIAADYFHTGFGGAGLYMKPDNMLAIPRFVMSKNVTRTKFALITHPITGPFYAAFKKVWR
jgi:peptidoglycan/xylan/chitin deacetylase (PgdA/CDA1 family)